MKPTKQSTFSDFKALDDHIEIFRAGSHTDSAGKSADWTTADLDEMVSNHSQANAAPIVIGHPKTNDPAHGWVESLKRNGDVLLAKFHRINPEFKAAVEAGSYLNRSIRILKEAGGLRLGHVGFLGAQLPAVGGLKPIDLNAADNTEFFDFESEAKELGLFEKLTAYIDSKFNAAANVSDMSKLTDLLESGISKASGERSEVIARMATAAGIEASTVTQILDGTIKTPPEQRLKGFASALNISLDALKKASPQDFSKQEGDMATKEELEAAEAKGAAKAKADFAVTETALQKKLDEQRDKQLLSDYQAVVTAHIKRGVAPATLAGAADFMATLDSEDGEFEFSQGEGDKAQTVKTKQLDFVKKLMDAIPATVCTKETDFSGDPAVNTDDADDIVKRASEFKLSEEKSGRTISVAAAVAHVTKDAK